jgi:hypothetical protein
MKHTDRTETREAQTRKLCIPARSLGLVGEKGTAENAEKRREILDLGFRASDSSSSTTTPHSTALEEDLRDHLIALDELTCRLADEQLRLFEQTEKLAAAWTHWEKEHYARVKELEGRNLQLRRDERALEERVAKLQQQQTENDRIRRSLEAWKARLALETTSWKAERERLLALVHSLELRVDRLSAILSDLPRSRQNHIPQGDSPVIEEHHQAQAEAHYVRLRQELQSLQGQHAADEQQIQELTALVERLAGFLLEEGDSSTLPMAKAA